MASRWITSEFWSGSGFGGSQSLCFDTSLESTWMIDPGVTAGVTRDTPDESLFQLEEDAGFALGGGFFLVLRERGEDAGGGEQAPPGGRGTATGAGRGGRGAHSPALPLVVLHDDLLRHLIRHNRRQHLLPVLHHDPGEPRAPSKQQH